MTPPRVLVTRAPHQGSALADHLRLLGADPVLVPAIEVVDPTSWAPLEDALRTLNEFHWLLFTSANAAEIFARRLPPLGLSSWTPKEAEREGSALPPNLRIAAIGAATERALQQNGLPCHLVPAQAAAESLTEALLPHACQADGTPTRFLLLRAEEAREHLPETLRAAGAEVTVVPVYRTVIPGASADLLGDLFSRDPAIAAITFTSSSAARNLVALCDSAGVRVPASALRISIGPITSQTLRNLGLPPHAEAPEASLLSLAETVVDTLAHRKG